VRRLLALALVVVVGVLAAPTTAQAAGQPEVPAAVPAPARTTAEPPPAPGDQRQVVVIGIAGLRWDDVGRDTPALAALAARGAVGALSVKAGAAVTCPADGWLTLGAGARATADVPRAPCTPQLPAITSHDRQRNLDSTDGARLGLLAEALGGLAVEGDGAALIAPGTPGSAVRVVDAGADPGAADRIVGGVVEELRGRAADLLVVGLSEAPGVGGAHLHVAIAVGPDFPPGSLRSASTRRDGFVQLIDVAPTVLALIGRTIPEDMDGQPWSVSGSARDVSGLRDLDARATVGKAATVPFFVALIAVVVIGAALGRRRPLVVRALGLGGLATLGASYAVMLVPWWRAPAAPVLLVLLSAAAGAVLTALALRTPAPGAVVAGAVWSLLVVDLLTGAHLQLESPAGYSSLVAGRFAGIGNVAFGIYGACALLATTALAAGRPRRATLLVVGATGLVAVAVDGAPPWGSDVGGVLALLPAYVLLGLLLSGTRVTALRLLLALVGAAAIVAGFALADYARPAGSRTHLGRFVAQVRDGTAGDVLSRKAHAIVDLLFANPITALLPLLVVAVVWTFRHPPTILAATFDREPALRPALLATGLLAALGLVLNDSGPAVVALALLVTALLVLAVAAGAGFAGGAVVPGGRHRPDGVAAGRAATSDP
jgi:hypothetical protein